MKNFIGILFAFIMLFANVSVASDATTTEKVCYNDVGVDIGYTATINAETSIPAITGIAPSSDVGLIANYRSIEVPELPSTIPLSFGGDKYGGNGVSCTNYKLPKTIAGLMIYRNTGHLHI